MSTFIRVPFTNTALSVGTAASLGLAADPQRQLLIIQNVHATNTVGYTLDGSTPVLATAGTFMLTANTRHTYELVVPIGPVNVIASGASTPVTIASN